MKPGAFGAKSRKAPVALIAIVVGVALVVGLGAGWYFVWSVTPPAEVVKAFLAAQDKMDWTGMSKCVTEKDRGKLEKLAKNPMAQNMKPRADMIPTYTYGETTYEEGDATVAVTVKLPPAMSSLLGGLSQLPAPCVLTKEGREWKLDLTATQAAQGKAQADLLSAAMQSMGRQPAAAPSQ